MKTVTTLHTTDIHTYKYNIIHRGVLWQQHCTTQKRQLHLYHIDEWGQLAVAPYVLTPELGQLWAPNFVTITTARSLHTEGLPISTGPTNEEWKVRDPCPTKLGTDVIFSCTAATVQLTDHCWPKPDSHPGSSWDLSSFLNSPASLLACPIFLLDRLFTPTKRPLKVLP
jgi:hypothetical protein